MRNSGQKATLWMCAMGAAVMLAGAAIASAQMGGMFGGGAASQFRGIFSPVVGEGAQYQMTMANQPKKDLSISVVGKDVVNGVPAYWMETVTLDPHAGGEVIMKMLTVINSGNTQTTKMIFQTPGRPPMEMDMQGGGGMPGGRQAPPQSADISKSGQDVGSESVTVPAGTFTCEHYRSAEGDDVWISSKVSPWGMVKMTGKNGTTMVLEKLITDAHDMITGTPTVIQMPNMGGMGGPPQQ